MKKLFLLCIAGLTLQASLFGMKRLPEETVEQEYTKKTKTMASQPGTMTYTLKRDMDIHQLTPEAAALYIASNGILKLDPAAVKLCGALTDISNMEGYVENYNDLTWLFSEEQMTDYEAIAIFDILNTITQSARHITINGQTAYLNKDVANITLQKIKQHNLYSLDGLKRIISICDFLICPTVLNACAKIVIEDQIPLMKQKIKIFDHFSNNSGVIPFLEKHSKRMDFGAKIRTYIPEFSVFDYIILNGIPNIEPECYVFSGEHLTSLDGLEPLTLLLSQQFSQVTIISFSYNYLNLADLTQLQKFFSHLTQLRELSLLENELTELPKNIFNNLTHLQILLLDHNKLIQLPENIFDNLIQLRVLRADHNQFSQLPKNIFNNLIQLQTLALNNNELTQLPENIFDNLTQLQMLYLYNNHFRQLPKNIFNNLTQLQLLHLNHNELNQLPKNIFDNLTRLRMLYLNDNVFSQLPDHIFDNLTELLGLYLNNNYLSELPEHVFDNLIQLQELYLNNNKFTQWPEHVFDKLIQLRVLKVNNNPLESTSEESKSESDEG
jgi:Leucine-rich repeat (LRR) protein